MIDSHCHLDHENLLSDLKNVLQRSKNVGIEKLLTISTSFESFCRVKELVNRDEMIYGMTRYFQTLSSWTIAQMMTSMLTSLTVTLVDRSCDESVRS